MKNHTPKEIERIYHLYEQILNNKKIVLEQDIFGIDELVYNPVTKSGGELGHGYDRGNRVPGIVWDGHWTHLHMGFTDKNTAMSVIYKANSLGLRTAQNPYASHPSVGKHTKDSFHYDTFEGLPVVGKGVDITGSHDKLVELIMWIENTYAGGAVTPYVDTKTDLDKVAGAAAVVGAYQLAKNMFSKNSGQSSTSTPSSTSTSVSSSDMGRAQKHKYGGSGEILF